VYRDDEASREARASALRTDVAALEDKLATLRRDAETIESNARDLAANDFGLLTRWWGIALVVVALAIGGAIGNQVGRGENEVERECPATR
jgi:hypothetical protein